MAEAPRTTLRVAVGRLVNARALALFVVTAAAYGLIARASLFFVLEPQHVAGIWPAAGLSIALLVTNDRRRWPAILAGVGVGVVVAYVTAGTNPVAAAGLSAANVIEPLLGATLLRRAGFVALSTLRDVGRFIGWGVVASAASAALVAASSSAIGSGGEFLPAAATWAFAHGGGMMAAAPLVLLIANPAMTPITRRPAPEVVAVALGLIVATGIAYVPITGDIQPSGYAMFLMCVITAIRLGPGGAAVATAVVAAIVTTGTLAGYGPIALLGTAPSVEMGHLHVLVMVVFLVSFVTAAALAERRAIADDLEAQRALEAARAVISDRLTEFAREIARSLDADALFQRVVQAAVEVIPADTARFSIAIGDAGTHRIVAAVGAPGAIGRTVEPGQGITGTVMRDAQLVVRDRVEAWERIGSSSDVAPNAPIAVACAPVVIGDAVVATLALGRVDVSTPFRPDEARALEMMAELTAIAMGNAVAFGKAQDLSIRDELTGVPNRRYFATSFAQLAAQRDRLPPESRVPVSAIMFDLDHFGPVNKERGHATGDVVLAEFGRLLAGRLRLADVVARYGGEEFVAVLVGTGREDAVRVAEEIRVAFEAMRMVGSDGQPIRSTVSAGVATVEPSDMSLDSLLPTADVALSMAKRAGRNTVSSA
ncbi:MAG: diguanylate cyclase [Chloroflexota bacterium]|nr:diguanylate cyclase [Chloroflexota bacterium]